MDDPTKAAILRIVQSLHVPVQRLKAARYALDQLGKHAEPSLLVGPAETAAGRATDVFGVGEFPLSADRRDQTSAAIRHVCTTYSTAAGIAADLAYSAANDVVFAMNAPDGDALPHERGGDTLPPAYPDSLTAARAVLPHLSQACFSEAFAATEGAAQSVTSMSRTQLPNHAAGLAAAAWGLRHAPLVLQRSSEPPLPMCLDQMCQLYGLGRRDDPALPYASLPPLLEPVPVQLWRPPARLVSAPAADRAPSRTGVPQVGPVFPGFTPRQDGGTGPTGRLR